MNEIAFFAWAMFWAGFGVGFLVAVLMLRKTYTNVYPYRKGDDLADESDMRGDKWPNG